MIRVSARTAERALLDWANIPRGHDAEGAAIDRLLRRYPEIFDKFSGYTGGQAEIDARIIELQTLLHAAWQSADLRTRTWFIFKIRESYLDATVWAHKLQEQHQKSSEARTQWLIDTWLERQSPPPLTPFEQVMFHFQVIGERARRCASPECPAPYFFTSKKGQRYCSQKCASPAQREAKRRWWNEHGSKRRAEKTQIRKG